MLALLHIVRKNVPMMSILALTKENKGMHLSHVSHPRLGVGSLSAFANRMECFADQTVSSRKN